MEGSGGTIFLLLIILTVGLIGPELFRRLKFPYFSSLIILGAILGPFGLGYVEPDAVIDFFGFLGLAFLMFMAGLESDLSHVKRADIGHISILSIVNTIIPALVGFVIVSAYGYSMQSAFVVAAIFISSSIEIIFPALKKTELFKKIQGKRMLAAVLLEDVVGLVLVSVFLHDVQLSPIGIGVYIALIFVSILLLKYFLPRIARLVLRRTNKEDGNERQLRFIIVILIGALVYFSGIGIHPILAAFLVGLLLADVLTAEKMRQKIHTLGYGLFVPVFFFVAGMQLDLRMIATLESRNGIVFALVFGAIISKFVSGYVGGKILKFSNEHATLFGALSTVHLSTALAATFAASTAGLIDATIVTALIVLTIVTSIFSPGVAEMFHRDYRKKG